MPRQVRAMAAQGGDRSREHASAPSAAVDDASIDEDVLIDYVQGNLSGPERESLERRLADDSDARRVVAALAELSIFSSTLPASGRSGEPTASQAASGPSPQGEVPEAGEVLADKYRVVAQLGRGAMGVVLEVEHVLLRERYALKLLRGGKAADKQAVQRLVREARAAMRIESPHVARVFDLGVLSDGRLFLVMELLAGSDLRSILREGVLPVDVAVRYIRQAALGVRAAHAAGVIHRDLKPANLFVAKTDGDECLKVVDFGLSKAPDVHRRAADDAALTSSGSVIGSPMYMAPEQIRDPKSADARSDVWALGVTLYEMVSGAPPYSARTVAGVLAAIMVDAPRPLGDRGVPPALAETILACLAKDPAARIQTADELLARLGRWQQPSVTAASISSAPGRRSPLRAIGWLAGALLVVGGGAAVAGMGAATPEAPEAARTAAVLDAVAAPIAPASASGETSDAPALPTSASSASAAPPEASALLPAAAAPAFHPRPAKPAAAAASASAPAEVIFGKETEDRR